MKSKAGERNGRSKLTAEEVRLIVKFLNIPRDSVHGTRDFLGRWFGVRAHTIGQIASGDRWSSVTGIIPQNPTPETQIKETSTSRDIRK